MTKLQGIAVAVSLSLLAPGIYAHAQEYTFKGGYPTPETIEEAFDDLDLNRAVHAYRFFYPTVSSAAIYEEMLRVGAEL
ncbi:hypothetical protein [Rhizobium sp. YS-1r]|uniref:hypothetical protein n=1 Tax=Rhizobium sp. YS-1r TaxID=1532558 RepID=UPI000510051B|nr:hypothetical protein [Rhizobium sp. YS-1r]KGD95039.1 hypothetical protein JL39_20350 [Rhizobium sp. YS-1r]